MEFLFDTATATFAASVEIKYENDYFLATVKAAGSNKCGLGDQQSVSGTVDFKRQSNVVGTGLMSGKYFCGESKSAAAGYELILQTYSIKYTPPGGAYSFEIKDVTIKLVGGVALEESNAVPSTLGAGAIAKSESAPAAQMKFKFGAEGTMIVQGAVFPSGLDVSAYASLNAHFGGGEAFTVDSAEVRLNFAFDTSIADDENGADPAFAVKGTAHYSYPCETGDSIDAEATVSVNVGSMKVPALDAAMQIFCKPVADEPRFLVTMRSREPIQVIAGVSINDFNLTARGFYGGEVVSGASVNKAVEAADVKLVEASSRWVFKGRVSGAVDVSKAAMDISGTASFFFDTGTGDIEVMLKVAFVKDGLALELEMQHATEALCDNVKGNYLDGLLEYSSSNIELVANITGASHCKYHETEATTIGIPELSVGGKVDALIKKLGDDVSVNKKGVAVVLDAINATVKSGEASAWPRYSIKGNFDGKLFGELTLKGSVHMFSLSDYASAPSIGNVTKWGVEFYASVTMGDIGDDSPLAMLKDFDVTVAVAGAMTTGGVGGGADKAVGVVVTASVSYASAGVEFDGWVTFMPNVLKSSSASSSGGSSGSAASMCTTVKTKMLFKAPGVDALKKLSINLEGEFFCQKREDGSFLDLKGVVDGGKSLNLGFFKLNDLSLELKLHESKDGSTKRRYAVGKLFGAISVGADSPLKVKALVGFNTAESFASWKYEATLQYENKWLSLDVKGYNSPSLTDSSCMDWTFDGAIKLTADPVYLDFATEGQYLCASDAEHNYALNARLISASVKLTSPVVITVQLLNVEMNVYGSESGAEEISRYHGQGTFAPSSRLTIRST